MNISVTNRCSRRCEYCFQKEWFLEGNGRGVQEMSIEMFQQILELMHPSDFNLMGGEPLLYSHLDEFLSICKKLEKKVCMFSNIIAPFLTMVKVVDNYPCVDSWLINTDFTPAQEDVFFKNLFYLSHYSDAHIGLATTLVPDSMKNLEKAERVAKILSYFTPEQSIHIRVAPATPTHNNMFQFYDYTDDMLQFCEHIFAVNKSANMGFDCPINACELHPEFIKQTRERIEFNTEYCYEPPLDFMPDGSVIWCSSSADVIKIPDFRIYNDDEELHTALKKQWYEYWDTHKMLCDYKNCSKFSPSTCMGLCLAKNEVMRKQLEMKAADMK